MTRAVGSVATTLALGVAMTTACVVTGVDGGPGDAPEFSTGSGKPVVVGAGGAGGAGGMAGADGGGAGGTAGAGGASGTAGTADGGGASGCDPACVLRHCGDCDGDASNGCEARLDTPGNCGACGRACGAGTCNLAGACDPEIFQGGGRVVAIGATAGGAAFSLRRFSPPSQGIHAVNGAMATLLTTVPALDERDRVVVEGSQVVFSQSTGVFEIPLAGGMLTDVRNGSEVYLAGADSTSAVVARVQVPPPGFFLERVTRSTGAGVFHCIDEYQDGSLEPSGTVLVAKTTGLFRYDLSSAGSACAGDPGVPLAMANVRRVVAGTSVAWFIVAGTPAELRSVDGAGVGSVIGPAEPADDGSFALGAVRDAVAYGELALGADGVEHFFVTVARADGTRTRAAALSSVPTALAADTQWLYVGVDGFLGRVPVP